MSPELKFKNETSKVDKIYIIEPNIENAAQLDIKNIPMIADSITSKRPLLTFLDHPALQFDPLMATACRDIIKQRKLLQKLTQEHFDVAYNGSSNGRCCPAEFGDLPELNLPGEKEMNWFVYYSLDVILFSIIVLHFLKYIMSPDLQMKNETRKVEKIYHIAPSLANAKQVDVKNMHLIADSFSQRRPFLTFFDHPIIEFDPIMATVCKDTLKEHELLQKLTNERFDVGIAEMYDYCPSALFHKLGVRTKIKVTSIHLIQMVSRNPTERLVKWVEFAAEFGDLPELNLPGEKEMNWEEEERKQK
uniref:glucuronosyltransferase n=1 Tax=Meloidogyne javanica TaxID=6303 RepID=A0A915M350_MELJA